MPPKRFRRIVSKTMRQTKAHGKWLFTEIEPEDNLLLNLGMGGDLLYHKDHSTAPEKYQFKLTFQDNSELTASFFWFGYIHLVSNKELIKHKMTGKLGISPTDENFTAEKLASILSGRRGMLKSFLLDQKNIAGIGNVYIQDPLFRAKLHPLRKIQTLTEAEIKALHLSIREVLNESIKLRGLKYEKDLYGRKGEYGPEQFMVAYKEGKPCPVCGKTIVKIKTGNTSSYICPECQQLKTSALGPAHGYRQLIQPRTSGRARPSD